MSICWYEDDELSISFSQFPRVIVQYIDPEDCLKPFKLENEIKVVIIDKIESETYDFIIPSGYCWDGASIPRFFWCLIGAKTDPRYLIPSLVHDVLCEHHEYIEDNRYLSTIIFERLLYVSKINPLSRWLMKHSVDNFQKFQKWGL